MIACWAVPKKKLESFSFRWKVLFFGTKGTRRVSIHAEVVYAAINAYDVMMKLKKKSF
jgi:hypothetical protein